MAKPLNNDEIENLLDYFKFIHNISSKKKPHEKHWVALLPDEIKLIVTLLQESKT